MENDEKEKLTRMFDKTKCMYLMDIKKATPGDVIFFKDPCNCKVVDGILCGQDCEHRAMDMNCEESCGNGRCSNQEVRLKSGGKDLELFQTLEMGWGVRTIKDIEADSYVISYIGEVMEKNQYKQRAKGTTNSYGMQITGNLVVDAQHHGNLARFLNSSCEPNLQVKLIYVDLLPIMTFWSLRKIRRGEQLFYNYKFSSFSGVDFECRCGAATCFRKKTRDGGFPKDYVYKHECILCPGKSFDNEKYLRQHKRKVHKITWKATDAELKSKRCSECGKVFQFASKLDEHLVTHISAQTEKCAFCSTLFKDKKHLKQHLKRIHGRMEVEL